MHSINKFLSLVCVRVCVAAAQYLQHIYTLHLLEDEAASVGARVCSLDQSQLRQPSNFGFREF